MHRQSNLSILGFSVRQNELEPCRAVLYPRRMTKRSPFRYFKPGPGFLDYLA